MRGPWRIMRLMGIDISVDWSWFIVLFLMVYTLGFVQFPRELHPRVFFPRADAVSISLGIGASLLLFGSVLAHELAHSWMAIERGIPVTNITLFIFGGVAQIADEPDEPGSEFLIAIMGPLMSIALAAVFGAAWLWLGILEDTRIIGVSVLPFIVLSGIIAQANGLLALFNLAPGFPLDGGRVLRAILWRGMHSVRRATRWATRAGQLIAVLLIALGAWQFFTTFNGGGIWYILIGFFLWNAASEGYRQALVRDVLAHVQVEELMSRPVEVVAPDISIDQFISRHLLPRREQTFAVADTSGTLGVLDLENLQRIPRVQWTYRPVREIMTPLGKMATLAPNETAATALSKLGRANADELPVVLGNQVIGFLGRAELSRYLRLRYRPGVTQVIESPRATPAT